MTDREKWAGVAVLGFLAYLFWRENVPPGDVTVRYGFPDEDGQCPAGFEWFDDGTILGGCRRFSDQGEEILV